MTTTTEDVNALLAFTREQRDRCARVAAEGLREHAQRPLTLSEEVQLEETLRQVDELDVRAERLSRLAQEGA